VAFGFNLIVSVVRDCLPAFLIEEHFLDVLAEKPARRDACFQGFLPSRSTPGSEPSDTPPGGGPKRDGSTQPRGKSGRTPSTYSEASRKENLKKNPWKSTGADQTVFTIQLQTARFKFRTDTPGPRSEVAIVTNLYLYRG
jgi:hypothetical protein